MYNAEILADLFPPYSVIRSCQGGFNVRVKPDGAFSDSFISDDKVACFSTKLPATIRLMETLYPELNGVYVRDAFLLLCADIHVLTRGEHYAVTQVSKITFFKEAVSIRGSGFLFKKYKGARGEAELLVPTGLGPIIAEVDNTWLDAAAPGWRTRYKLSCDLDMSTIDSLRVMVTLQHNVPVGVLPPSFY